MEGQPQVWERQPGESAKAWEARKTYLEMGPERSLAKAGQKLGKNLTTIEGWSTRWGWVRSAQLYDAHLDEIASKAATERIAAEGKVLAEKWKRRSFEQPDADYLTYSYLVNKLSSIGSGKTTASLKDELLIARSIARLSPIARQACIDMMGRLAVQHPERQEESSKDDPDFVPGRTLAVLKAFLDFKPENS